MVVWPSITTCGPTLVPAPMRTCGPMMEYGPTSTELSSSALESMSAVEWMPAILLPRRLARVLRAADGAHQFRFQRHLAVDRADCLVFPDAARHAQDFHVHLQLVARLHRTLEACIVDTDKIHHRIFIGFHAHGQEGQQSGRLRP